MCFSRNLSISSRLFNLLNIYNCLVSYDPLYFCGISGNVSTFIFDVFISVFSHFFLAGIAKGLSILVIFSKIQIFVLLMFSIDFLVSIAFISSWVIMLGCLCEICHFNMQLFITMNFTLRTIFAHIVISGMLCFSFHLFQDIFWFYILISSLTCCL